jgi:hypothetical protein
MKVLERLFDAGLSRSREGIEIESASGARFCADREGFQDVSTAA